MIKCILEWWRKIMPIKRCTSDGKSGYKWGDSGKCYTGDNGKELARKQGISIELSKQKAGKPSEFDKASLPTEQMSINATKGLELRAKYGKGGENLVVLTLAQKIAVGEFISNDEKKVLGRLYNNRKRFANANENTIGYINYLLLGGQETELWMTHTGSES